MNDIGRKDNAVRNARRIRAGSLALALVFMVSIIACSGKIYAGPDRKRIHSTVQSMRATPTTPDNLDERARELKQILRTLEMKHGRREINKIVGPGTIQRFKRARRSGDHDAASRIADEIINDLASFEGAREAGPQKKADDEHIVTFRAGDGRTTYGYLERPAGEGRFPAVVLVHGGKSSKQATLKLGQGRQASRFNREGYVTLAVDYRRSEFGGKEIDDVIAAVRYLKSLDYVDPQRIALFGSSHGAYMSLMAAAELGNEIKAVVENFGFTDLEQQYYNVAEGGTSHSEKDARELINMGDKYFGGSPKESPDEYQERSPVYQVDRIQAPVLIIHGKNDRSVPVRQAYRLRDALEKAGKPYRTKFYRNGPHGFIYTGTPEADDAGKTAVRFLDEHLKSAAPLPEAGKLKETGGKKILPYPYADSPFGFHSSYYDTSPYEHAPDLGVRWDRGAGLGGYITPMPHNAGRGDRNKVINEFKRRVRDNIVVYDHFDRFMKMVPEGMHIVQNIAPVKKEVRPWVKFFNRPNSWLPEREYVEYYKTFVRNVVERYDGDGVSDMPGLSVPVKYWQISNEPHYKAGLRDLAELVRITVPVIKQADPGAGIILGGASLQPLVDKYLEQLNTYYYPILRRLDGTELEVFDFHWYGKADGDYKKVKVVYDDIRENLDRLGFDETEIWITEMGSYSGLPGGSRYAWPLQTEEEQAADLLKRYVYSLSLGVKKVFWAWGVIEGFSRPDDNSYFDHTGLIYDGKKLASGDIDRGRGVKKLSYYTYKIMTRKLEGSDWDNILNVREDDSVHIYRFMKGDDPVWVAWNDSPAEKNIIIEGVRSDTVLITDAVPPYASGKAAGRGREVYKSVRAGVSEGSLSYTLDSIPVFIEEL